MTTEKHNAPQPDKQGADTPEMPYNTPRHLRRRENLRLLTHEAGGVTALGLLTDTPKSHLSAILSGRRGVGDLLAAKIERRMGKPSGWFDIPPAGGDAATLAAAIEHEAEEHPADVLEVSDLGWTMLGEFEDLPAEMRREIADMVRERHHDWHARVIEVIRHFAPTETGVEPLLPPVQRPSGETVRRVYRLPDWRSAGKDGAKK
jgi:hypothetical protein